MKTFFFLRAAMGSILLFLISCQYVTFDTPQPVGEKDIKGVPKRLIGQYVSEDKTNTLFVTQNLITRVYDLDISIHKKDIDTTMRLNGDSLVSQDNSSVFIVKQFGDSLKTHYHVVDTLYMTGTKHTLRKQKGYYYISEMAGLNQWAVLQLGLSKGVLTMGSLSSLKDIEAAAEIKESAQDSTETKNYAVNKKQFKLIVKNNGFTEETKYFKVRPSK